MLLVERVGSTSFLLAVASFRVCQHVQKLVSIEELPHVQVLGMVCKFQRDYGKLLGLDRLEHVKEVSVQQSSQYFIHAFAIFEPELLGSLLVCCLSLGLQKEFVLLRVLDEVRLFGFSSEFFEFLLVVVDTAILLVEHELFL